MTFSDIIEDVPNHSITPHLIPLVIGIVLMGVSVSFKTIPKRFKTIRTFKG